MPIKFRCQHCRQFLGIARKQAGGLVDCPMCGRTVRVPHLDGRLDPLPDPQLDLKDSVLVNALDELAALGEDKPYFLEEAKEEQTAEVAQKPAIPLSAPEPITIDPPLPAKPVKHAGSEPAASPKLTSSIIDRELSELARKGTETSTPSATSKTVSSSKLWWIAGMLLLFSAGFFTHSLLFPLVLSKERTQTVPSAGQNQSSDNIASQSLANTPSSNNENETPELSSSEVTLTGAITWETANGESKPDKGARLILFPESKTGASLFSIAGAQVSAQEVDIRILQKCFEELGGGFAVADEQGHFSFSSVPVGKYQLLVISRYQRSLEEDQISVSVQKLLDSYFLRGTVFRDQILSHVRYHLDSLNLNQNGITEWNYSFTNE